MTDKNLNTKENKNTPPSNWVETTLGEVADIVTDYVANGSFASLKDNVTYLKNGYARLIRLVDHKRNYSDDAVFVSENSYNFLKKSKLFPNDIIISNVGEYSGTVFRVPNLNIPMTLGPNAILIKFGDSNDFMYYFLTSPLGQHLVNSIKSGSANPKFNKTDFKKIKFLLPPLPEQQAIASVLSSVDDKIELLREENKTLEEIGKTIFKEWFGNYGLDDFVKAHEILEFEKGVEIGSKNYFENKNNLENPEMFYRVGDIANNGNNSSLYCEKDLLKNRIFKKDDVLVSFDGTIGRVFVGGNGGYSSGIRKVFDKNKKIKSSFLYFWAKSEQVQETISLYSEGTTIQHAGKSIPYLEIISNQENIDEITESLNSIFIKILDNLDQIQYLARSRDELLPKLTSGQIRVNNFNKN
jgi:type I restriction enzyme S subunit